MHSHDGIQDSFTRLSAPSALYEHLRHELSRCERDGSALWLIRFVLKAHSPYEFEVLSFAQTLHEICRVEDLCARTGELEFILVLRSDEKGAHIALRRIWEKWQIDPEYSALECSSISSNTGEGALELLNRLELEPTLTSL